MEEGDDEDEDLEPDEDAIVVLVEVVEDEEL